MIWGCRYIGYTVTGSVPIGFYRIQPIGQNFSVRRGDYVAFCLPSSIAYIGKKAGYLAQGSCNERTDALVKKVIALPGDTVTVSDKVIIVNGKIYPAPVLKTDQHHHTVKRLIANGIYISHCVWVYGNGDIEHSWDSRYYGGIAINSIKKRMIPLLTFS